MLAEAFALGLRLCAPHGLIARLAGAVLAVVGVADLANNLPIVLLMLGLSAPWHPSCAS